MRNIIPEIKTTMEEDLRVIGLGDLLAEDTQEEACVCADDDKKSKVKKALVKYQESYDKEYKDEYHANKGKADKAGKDDDLSGYTTLERQKSAKSARPILKAKPSTSISVASAIQKFKDKNK